MARFDQAPGVLTWGEIRTAALPPRSARMPPPLRPLVWQDKPCPHPGQIVSAGFGLPPIGRAGAAGDFS